MVRFRSAGCRISDGDDAWTQMQGPIAHCCDGQRESSMAERLKVFGVWLGGGPPVLRTSKDVRSGTPVKVSPGSLHYNAGRRLAAATLALQQFQGLWARQRGRNWG